MCQLRLSRERHDSLSTCMRYGLPACTKCAHDDGCKACAEQPLPPRLPPSQDGLIDLTASPEQPPVQIDFALAPHTVFTRPIDDKVRKMKLRRGMLTGWCDDFYTGDVFPEAMVPVLVKKIRKKISTPRRSSTASRSKRSCDPATSNSSLRCTFAG
jgi:hypothetical protein